MSKDPSVSRYWDAEMEKARAARTDALWYRYMRAIYDEVLGGLAEPPCGPSLKTDLYEEAVAESAPLPALPEPRFGVDISPGVVLAAGRNLQRRGVACALVAADARRLPFADETFGFVLSGSTLDHFTDRRDLHAGLGELARVLAPGGTLALTLDNPHNPVLMARRSLGWLSRRRLHPYFVGETLGRREGEEALRALGLDVRRTTAVAHAPRDPAMRLARRLERRGGADGHDRLIARLAGFERLGAAPTRWRTGYYLAFEAVKPERPSGARRLTYRTEPP